MHVCMHTCNQDMTLTMCFKILFIMGIIANNMGLEKKFETVILLGNKITTHNQNHALRISVTKNLYKCQISALTNASNHV